VRNLLSRLSKGKKYNWKKLSHEDLLELYREFFVTFDKDEKKFRKFYKKMSYMDFLDMIDFGLLRFRDRGLVPEDVTVDQMFK